MESATASPAAHSLGRGCHGCSEDSRVSCWTVVVASDTVFTGVTVRRKSADYS